MADKGNVTRLRSSGAAVGLLDRVRFFSQVIGTMFGGNRDLYKVFGYKRDLTYLNKLGKWRRQDIAARIVEAEPTATWSSPPLIVTKEDASDNPEAPTQSEEFKTAWNNIVTGNKLWSVLARLDKLVGIGKYAVLVIGFSDGGQLDQPLTENISQNGQNGQNLREVLYLQPYSENSAEIIEYDENSNSPRFGLPTKYRIKPAKTDILVGRVRQIFTAKEFDIHWSRVVHVAENTLEDEIIGTPRIERVYNLLDDLLKVVGGSSETFWLVGNRGLQIDIDKDMELDPDDADALQDEVEEYEHGLSRIMKTRGVKVNSLGSDSPSPRGNFDVLVALLSGATGIPQRILLGSEAGQLASEQDRANWANRIEERRKLFAEPEILTPLIQRLVIAGALPAPEILQYLWPNAFKQNPLERSQTSAQMARSLANVSKALETKEGTESKLEITSDEARTVIGLDNLGPTFDDPRDVTDTSR